MDILRYLQKIPTKITNCKILQKSYVRPADVYWSLGNRENSSKSYKIFPTAAVFIFGSPTEVLRRFYITPNPTEYWSLQIFDRFLP